MATTRLRKAFRYPDDSGDDELGREELDEEEQDLVIRQLQAQNDKRNSEYTIIFSVIPLLSATIYVPPIISSSSTLSERLLSILSVISLLLTAYTMKYHAIERRDPKGKRPITKTDLITSAQKYAIRTNAALCALLALASIMASPTAVVTYLIPAGESWARHYLLTDTFWPQVRELMQHSNTRDHFDSAESNGVRRHQAS